MNGATAEPSVRTKSRPRRTRITIGGPSHHFLLTRRYSQISASRDSLRLVLVMIFAMLKTLHFTSESVKPPDFFH